MSIRSIRASCNHLSRHVRKLTFGHMHPAKIQISLRFRAGWLEPSQLILDSKGCKFSLCEQIRLNRLRRCSSWFVSEWHYWGFQFNFKIPWWFIRYWQYLLWPNGGPHIPFRTQLNRANSSDTEAPIWIWIYVYLMVQFPPKFIINGTILILI